LKQLNPYKTNLKTATKLLQQAGMTKKSGKWYLPNGSQWTITLYTVAGFNDVIEAFQNIANQLSSFGIDAQPQLIPPTRSTWQICPSRNTRWASGSAPLLFHITSWRGSMVCPMATR
jgi:ABC-type transport system substrate-binding protein